MPLWMTRLGYWLRPFDMIADRRRWRWQGRTRCGRQVWADAPPEAKAAVLDAIERFRGDEGGE